MKALLLALLFGQAAASMQWTAVDGSIPPGLTPLVPLDAATPASVLGRIQLPGGAGSSPGVVSGGVCVTPFKGVALQSPRYEVATGATLSWCGEDWARATPVGQQGAIEVFFCRAPVFLADKRVEWAYGKAYRSGRHAKRAYVAWNGREIELTQGYELAVLTAP
ncbi:MAG: hypothetical protein WDM96_17045 [Lacunisphaera sp.]